MRSVARCGARPAVVDFAADEVISTNLAIDWLRDVCNVRATTKLPNVAIACSLV
jgi:hypothetical protein